MKRYDVYGLWFSYLYLRRERQCIYALHIGIPLQFVCGAPGWFEKAQIPFSLHGGEVFRSVAGPKPFDARVFYERDNTLMIDFLSSAKKGILFYSKPAW